MVARRSLIPAVRGRGPATRFGAIGGLLDAAPVCVFEDAVGRGQALGLGSGWGAFLRGGVDDGTFFRRAFFVNGGAEHGIREGHGFVVDVEGQGGFVGVHVDVAGDGDRVARDAASLPLHKNLSTSNVELRIGRCFVRLLQRQQLRAYEVITAFDIRW